MPSLGPCGTSMELSVSAEHRATSKLIQYGLDRRAGEVLFSPSHHDLNARDLADWVVADNLPVRLQLQLHKYLWNDEPGR